jgi:DNA-binding IclR family transcriptional regulator
MNETAKGGDKMTAKSEGTISPNELAAEMGINPKSLRRFMRSLTDERAGRGNRWELTPETCEAIKTRYAEQNRQRVTFRIDK